MKLNNYKIKFINHSSLLIDDGEYKILTDPWFISPAFDGWYQKPFPKFNDIKDILSNKKKLLIVVSHGHDDHIDDYFIKNYLHDCQMIIPQYKSKGFLKRLEKISSKKPIEIPLGFLNPLKLGSNKFYAHSNEGSENDSIITIANDKNVIIHANDNYRTQPSDIVENIKKISKNKKLYYFSQIGIANSYPVNAYLSLKEKEEFIENEHKRFISCFEENIKATGADYAFSYANQFQFDNNDNLSYFENAKKLISKNRYIKQLFPGDIILNEKFSASNNHDEIDIFEKALKHMEKLTNDFVKSKIKTEITINFKVKFNNNLNTLKPKKNIIYLTCNTSLWLSIITGKTNLETILIGGNGDIIKLEHQNMKYISRYLSEYAYIYQNRISKNLQIFN